MKLYLNSPTARLYRWYYVKEEMPQSLCPYFWKLLLMWVFFIPCVIFSLPRMLFEKSSPVARFYERWLCGLFIWAILISILSSLFSISVFWYIYPKDTALYNVQICGMIFLIVYVILFVIFLVGKIKDSTKHKRNIKFKIKEKRPSIVKEFIKAKYNKYCPRIEWATKQSQTTNLK